MYKIGEIVKKHTILGVASIKSPYKYNVKCNNCGAEGEKWYNSMQHCWLCKARNRKIIDKGSYYELELTGGEYTKIDKEDYKKLKNNCWYKSLRNNVESRIKGKLLKLHRLLMNAPKGKVVDHKNGNTLDNRKSNLRICTIGENSRNQHKIQGKNKYKGIHWSNNRKRFEARLVREGKVYSKTFKNEIDAVMWYDITVKKVHGDFAVTNKMLGKY